MSIHIHSDYYHDFLEKRRCLHCLKTFIIGSELGESVNGKISCPYCKYEETEATAAMVEPAQLDELGCMGISFHKQGGQYFTRCVACHEMLTPESKEVDILCKTCSEKFRQGGGSDKADGDIR